MGLLLFSFLLGFWKTNMVKRPKNISCLCARGRFCNCWCLTLLSDGLDSQSQSDYEDEVVSFKIC